jgi:hypothetical protein
MQIRAVFLFEFRNESCQSFGCTKRSQNGHQQRYRIKKSVLAKALDAKHPDRNNAVSE